MALFMDGFDYYTDTGADQLQSKWDTGSKVASISAIGSGTFAYGRSAQIGDPALSKTLANVIGAGSANWGTVYLCFHIKPSTTLGDNTERVVQFIDGASNQLNLRITVGGIWKLYRDGTLLATGTNAMTTGNWYFIAIKAVISTAAGSFKMFMSGPGVSGTELNYSGDTANTANDYVNKISFLRAASASAGQWEMDNCHIYDGADGAPWNAISAERRVYFNLATGNGADAAWTPSAGAIYQCVDENPVNSDTDYISSSTVGQKASVTMPALTNFTVDAVQMTIFARRDDAGPRGIKSYVDISGTDYESGEFLVGATYLFWVYNWILSPATSAAWGLAEYNGAEWGVHLTT